MYYSRLEMKAHIRLSMLFSILIFNSIFGFVASIIDSHNGIHSQAFIQTDNELKLMIDGVQINFPPEKFPNFGFESGKVPASPVRFDPPFLDFKQNPIGQPHLEQVTLFNSDVERVVHLLSISASTPHFHCSFFADKVIPVEGNTTFDVVFLPREVGNVENTLYIHTSRGTYKYQVFGVGTPSPYRLQTYVGARIPVNTSFSPYIHLYNPHPHALQITEMYTSGGDLHLELPSGVREGPQKLWEIPAYETRTVMRLRLVGRKPANNTAFIRIKTNHTEEPNGFVLPVEVEVSNKPGLYSPVEKLNFGLLRSLDSPKPMKLVLINASNKTVYISKVELERPNDAISIDFRPTHILHGLARQSLVALVTFSAIKAIQPRQWSGNIVVRSALDEFVVHIPYSADILHGSLEYESNTTKFYGGDKGEPLIRSMPLTNRFNFSVVVYSITLQGEALKYFKVVDLKGPSLIGPQETREIFSLQFSPHAPGTAVSPQIISQMGIFSNASLFVIPIFVYHGKLTVLPHNPEINKGYLNFGTLGIGEVKSLTFTLKNENPVDIHIEHITANWQYAQLELKGIQRGKGGPLNDLHDSRYPLILKPYHHAVYNLTVKAPNANEIFASDIRIRTQLEILDIPYTLRTAGGSLKGVPEVLVLENSFPGKLTRAKLFIKSSFSDLTELKKVSFQPSNARFLFEPLASRPLPIGLNPNKVTHVGDVLFDTSKDCVDLYRVTGNAKTCYVGFNLDTELGQSWLQSLSLNASVPDLDHGIIVSLVKQWQHLQASDSHQVNATLLFDTPTVKGFQGRVQVDLEWPSILRQGPSTPGQLAKLDMPLTQLGNTTQRDVILFNPSTSPVYVQALPLTAYPNPGLLLERLMLGQHQLEMENGSSIFGVHLPPGTPPLKLPLASHSSSAALLLRPGCTHTLRVSFSPQAMPIVTSLVLLRNNLTGLETIWVEGRGGEPRLYLGPSSTLLFELTEKHLKYCDKVHMKSTADFMVRRPLVLYNTGELPIFISGFSIGSAEKGQIEPAPYSWCSGYGFQVDACSGFWLAANTSHKLEVSFTPDFSLHRVRHQLRVHSSLPSSPQTITLLATLPPRILHRCADSLDRPSLEPTLWIILTSTCILVTIFAGILAKTEAERIYTEHVIHRHLIATHPGNQFNPLFVFDLRSLKLGPITLTPTIKPVNLTISGREHSTNNALWYFICDTIRYIWAFLDIRRFFICTINETPPLPTLNQPKEEPISTELKEPIGSKPIKTDSCKVKTLEVRNRGEKTSRRTKGANKGGGREGRGRLTAALSTSSVTTSPEDREPISDPLDFDPIDIPRQGKGKKSGPVQSSLSGVVKRSVVKRGDEERSVDPVEDSLSTDSSLDGKASRRGARTSDVSITSDPTPDISVTPDLTQDVTNTSDTTVPKIELQPRRHSTTDTRMPKARLKNRTAKSDVKVNAVQQKQVKNTTPEKTPIDPPKKSKISHTAQPFVPANQSYSVPQEEMSVPLLSSPYEMPFNDFDQANYDTRTDDSDSPPIWEDVPKECLKAATGDRSPLYWSDTPDTFESLAAQTDEFARFIDFMPPNCSAPPHNIRPLLSLPTHPPIQSLLSLPFPNEPPLNDDPAILEAGSTVWRDCETPYGIHGYMPYQSPHPPPQQILHQQPLQHMPQWALDAQPLPTVSDVYSLTNITKDRRQSMLDYEKRRCSSPRQEPDLLNLPAARQTILAAEQAMDPRERMAFRLGLGISAAFNDGWSPETEVMPRHPWGDSGAEPGSKDDPQAKNLIPPGLLSSEVSWPLGTDPVWSPPLPLPPPSPSPPQFKDTEEKK